MRVSVHKNDRGYFKRAYMFQPHLNGVKVMNCFTADEDLGYVDRYQTDEGGHVIINETKDALLIERLHGVVDIVYVGLIQKGKGGTHVKTREKAKSVGKKKANGKPKQAAAE